MLVTFKRLAGGLGTASLAVLTMLCWALVGAACLLGVGLLLVLPMVAVTRALAERERERLRRRGVEIVSPYTQDRMPGAGWAARMRAVRADRATLRDLGWLGSHATLGLLCGVLGVLMPIAAVREISYPLWWQLLPPQEQTTNFDVPVQTWPAAIFTSFMGAVVLVGLIRLSPALTRLQEHPATRLLVPHPSVDLSKRIVQLTATRAGALRAHATELRRIERALHDGTQNRLNAVVVTVAAAKRAVARDPERALHALDRAQNAAEQAAAELRAVVRALLPPILEDRGLSGALSALASGCAVPCRLTVGETGPVPLSVETAAYFTVAEALTNVSKHSGARQAEVLVERNGPALRIMVRDDGKGGARDDTGTGLAGIRRRVEAHDGMMTLTSPCGGPTVIEVELPCES
ncbi:sensor histidine kinase [Nonomuraea typhae]|uniref:sensor histidine kinase n=1 Tax=Nonomuraea typhae TaxID=2603600 RepID=UPI0012FC094D|nr:sensor histidine kinase [Nonomuraea typhae]